MSDKLLTAAVRSEIDHWLQKFPEDQKQSAVIPALMAVQKENGHLTDPLMSAVAEYLEMPAIAVFEVASFYSMYDLKPVGRHKISVCTNISCQLLGSRDVVKHLEEKLNIKCGGTTKDGRITLESVECLAACVNAPMMQVGEHYHEKLTAEKIDKIVDTLE